MPKQVTLEELVALNPNVDRKLLEGIADLRNRLCQSGLGGAKYRLASPITRRRVVVDEDTGKDPRTVHLGRRR